MKTGPNFALARFPSLASPDPSLVGRCLYFKKTTRPDDREENPIEIKLAHFLFLPEWAPSSVQH